MNIYLHTIIYDINYIVVTFHIVCELYMIHYKITVMIN